MPVSVGKIVVKVVYVMVLGIILVAGVTVLVPGFQNYRLLSAKRADLEKSNRRQQQALAELQRMQRRFKEEPDFVERIARQNKRVRAGEIAFIFEDAN